MMSADSEHCCQARRAIRGYTLLELLITLAVLALVATMAMPDLSESVSRNSRESAMLDLMSSLALARAHAVNADTTVALCRSRDQLNCASNIQDWNSGWLIFSDAGASGVMDGTDEILQVHGALPERVAVHLFDGAGAGWASHALRFNRQGYLANSASGAYFRFCSLGQGPESARAIWIASTGRAAMSVANEQGLHADLKGAVLQCP